MRRWITVIIGLLIVVGSMLGFAQYMKSYELNVTMMQTVKPVKMIQAGELITKEMVRLVSIPTVQHMDNGITNANQIVGKRAIVPIGEAEEFLSWKIGKDTLYPKADEQYVGFKVDFVSAVNNMIRRGDKVDVWVEYTSPKIVDTFGQEIVPDQLNPNATSTGKKIYSERLIKGLTVAYLKDQEGKEVTDTGGKAYSIALPGGSASAHDDNNSEYYRQNASALPSYITFIMNEEQYALFAKGQKEGSIKFGLPSTAVTIGSIVPNSPGSENGSNGGNNK
jgi:hypothetical protein